MNTPLVRLEPVGLREVWPDEARNFTPWLADNLDVLEKTLDIGLELERVEEMVGQFKADIICKNTDDPAARRVLIENQLEPTDHNHLGQLITYAAGLEAVTIVWIAEKFREEHRAAIDWLNETTGEGIFFFGLEIELWRIGGSPPAPKFNIVSKPNDWSKSIRERDNVITPVKEMRVAYWSDFHEVLNKVGGPVSGFRKAQPEPWMTYAVGKANFYLEAAFKTRIKQVQVKLRMPSEFLDLLTQEKAAIEEELGDGFSPLVSKKFAKGAWIAPPHLENVDPEKKSDWPQQHKWLAERLNKMHEVYAPRIKDLDPDEWEPDNRRQRID